MKKEEEETSFDWREALRRASSSSDWDTLRERAEQWTTCACGEQDGRIPRSERNGEPLDYQLADLGMKFYSAVWALDRDEALSLIDEIEQRAGEILRDLASVADLPGIGK